MEYHPYFVYFTFSVQQIKDNLFIATKKRTTIRISQYFHFT